MQQTLFPFVINSDLNSDYQFNAIKMIIVHFWETNEWEQLDLSLVSGTPLYCALATMAMVPSSWMASGCQVTFASWYSVLPQLFAIRDRCLPQFAISDSCHHHHARLLLHLWPRLWYQEYLHPHSQLYQEVGGRTEEVTQESKTTSSGSSCQSG